MPDIDAAAQAASGSLVSVLPWVSLAFSIVAVVLSVVLRRAQASEAGRELGVAVSDATRLGDRCGQVESNASELRSTLQGIRSMLSRLAEEQAASVIDQAPDRSDGAADPAQREESARIELFLDLVQAWVRLAGQTLRGAALSDWKSIDELTIPGGQSRNLKETQLVFTAAARRVVEYAVAASGVKSSETDEEHLDGLLEQMAGMVGLTLIKPRQGQRYDSKVHELISTVAAGSNQRGTIAKAEVRGLVRGNGSLIKAKVQIFD